MRKIIIVIVLLCVSGVYAQNNLNTYKYVIVPKQFEFQKSQNEYQLNDMTKFLFEKYNFNPVFEGSFPEDLYRDNCLGLRSSIVDESNMFVTKLKVELRDCNNNIVYTSKTGTSKQKEYRATYQQALRRAFESFKTLNYQYSPKKKINPGKIVNSKIPEVPAAPKIETQVAVPEEETVSETSVIKKAFTKKNNPVVSALPILYAQAIPKGFQLVDTNPQVVFKIHQTGKTDVYLLADKKGLFYKEGDRWVAEYWESGKMFKKTYIVKF